MRTMCLGCRVETADPSATPGDAATLAMVLVGIEARIRGAPFTICARHAKLESIGTEARKAAKANAL